MRRFIVLSALICFTFCCSSCDKNDTRPDSHAIVTIRERDVDVLITASPDGPLYTVRKKNGEVLADALDIETLEKEQPELSKRIRSMIAQQDDSVHADFTPKKEIPVTE